MENNIWKINETIHCQQLTSDYLDRALTLIEIAFFPYENISTTLKISDDPEALKELRNLTTAAAKDGVTIIAVETKTDKIVGAAFNKIQVKGDNAFDKFAKSWKRTPSKGIVGFMSYFDSLCDLFEHCKTDCIFEEMFIATLPEYRRKGIGNKLTEISIEIATKLAKGVNVKKSVDGNELSLGPKPTIISAIFTSSVTQKIGRKFGFEIAVDMKYKDLKFENMDFGKVVEEGTSNLTLEYKHLL